MHPNRWDHITFWGACLVFVAVMAFVLTLPAGPGPARAASVAANPALHTLVAPAAADVTSALYDGSGASNALQPAADWTAFAILGTAPTTIDADGATAIDLWLMNTTAAQGCSLVVLESSASPATAATVIRATEVTISGTDQAFDADQAAWGLAAGTDKAAKQPVRVAVTPGAYVSLFVSASDGGVWYARYQLRGGF